MQRRLSPVQRDRLAEVVAARRARDDAEAAYEARLSDAIDHGVSVTAIATRLGVCRMTVYRHTERDAARGR